MKTSALPLRYWRGLSRVTIVGLMIFLSACGEKPSGTVSGTVKYKGQPLTSGTVNFMASERGAGIEIKIDEEGKFESKAPLDVGKYKVFVNPPRPEQLPPGSKPSPKASFPPIAPKYQDPGQTPLSAEIKVGPNVVPVEIPN